MLSPLAAPPVVHSQFLPASHQVQIIVYSADAIGFFYGCIGVVVATPVLL
jgi:hypothetical protein